MHQKWSSFVSLSTKRFTLSPTFLKKRMSSPIGKFAHKGITGRSLDSVFSLVFVIWMQGRENSALDRPPYPCSALNECYLCGKNIFHVDPRTVFSLFQLCAVRFAH